MTTKKENKINGAIKGGILGDILGLRYEGVNPKHINNDNILKKTFFNKCSDDTEHLLIMINCINTTNNIEDFNNKFIKNLRKWIFTLPYGIGKATLKSIIKSFIFKKSGVKSQGNGALMRSGVLGLYLNNELDNYIKSNVILTHNSIESIQTSLMFANILKQIINNDYIEKKDILSILDKYNFKEFEPYLNDIKESLNNNIKPIDLSNKWTNNRGAYGYTIITLALSVYVFLYDKNNLLNGMKLIIECGGDTDTNAFVFGMISGAYNNDNTFDESYKNIINNKIKYYLKKDNNELNYINIFINNIITIPLVFIEIFKRYIYILINKKI